MKKILFIVIGTVVLVGIPRTLTAASFPERLSGRILIQTESYGRAWYVSPHDGTRYYLRNGEEAYTIMRTLGLGISDRDLQGIPIRKADPVDRALVARTSGKILLQIEAHGEAWYVNPVDGLRYYLKDGEAAYAMLRQFGLGITDKDLRQIPINETQVVADYAFAGASHVVVNGNGVFSKGYRAEVILPLASLTKLMTALVLNDIILQWDEEVTLTPEIIDYPVSLVGDDVTSEVEFAAGDRLSRADLLSAMLVSSSNQAAIALARSTGLTDREFVARMNEKAHAMGLAKTVFVEPAGLDAHNVSTAEEFARIAFAAFQVPLIRYGSGLHDATISLIHADGASELVSIKNRNYSLMQMGFDNAKTGYLVEAKLNVAVRRGDQVAVVLHAENSRERNSILQRIIP